MHLDGTIQPALVQLKRIGLTVTVLLIAPCLSRCDVISAPTDGQLIQLFRSHRDAFERLAAMATEDMGTVSYLSVETLSEPHPTDGRQNLSSARRSEYMRLLTSIRPDLVLRIATDRISFSYSSGGVGLSVNQSWIKGLAYLPSGSQRVGIVVTSLDKLPTRDDVYLVPIEHKWYVIYVKLD